MTAEFLKTSDKNRSEFLWLIKFMFSKKATKIDEIFTVDLADTTYCQIDGKDFVKFCGLLRIYDYEL